MIPSAKSQRLFDSSSGSMVPSLSNPLSVLATFQPEDKKSLFITIR